MQLVFNVLHWTEWAVHQWLLWLAALRKCAQATCSASAMQFGCLTSAGCRHQYDCQRKYSARNVLAGMNCRYRSTACSASWTFLLAQTDSSKPDNCNAIDVWLRSFSSSCAVTVSINGRKTASLKYSSADVAGTWWCCCHPLSRDIKISPPLTSAAYENIRW